MPAIHIEKFKVRHYECDTYGHLNNAVYLRFMQQAGIEAAAAVGFTDEMHITLNRSWIPASQPLITYVPSDIAKTWK